MPALWEHHHRILNPKSEIRQFALYSNENRKFADYIKLTNLLKLWINTKWVNFNFQTPNSKNRDVVWNFSSMSKRKKLIVIGRSDVVDLPKKTVIAFNLLDPSHPEYNEKEFIIKKYTKTTVKSSTGHTEDRYVIETNIQIFNKIYPIELSLSDRKDMKFPILIGRKLYFE